MFLNILLVLLILLAALLAVVLFVPFSLRIDTVEEVYRADWKGIISFRFSEEDERLVFTLKIPFYQKSFDPFKSSTKPAKKEEPTKTKKKDKGTSPVSMRQILGMVRSFHVKVCNITINTGDYVQNALLVPLLQVINRTGGNFSVSFHSGSSVQFYASNTLWRLGRAYIMNSSKLKN